MASCVQCWQGDEWGLQEENSKVEHPLQVRWAENGLRVLTFKQDRKCVGDSSLREGELEQQQKPFRFKVQAWYFPGTKREKTVTMA